jgi:steroid delta-isomerase-like uncharacterized protein
MMSVDNKAIVRRLYEEVWNKRKLELINELVLPSHGLTGPGPNFVGSSIGPEAYAQQVILFTTGFPDLDFKVEEIIAEGDRVVSHWTISGTHKGEFMGVPATNRKVSFDGITIHQMSKGRIMDSYVSWDIWGLMQQLGVAPALGQPQSASAR